MFKRIISTLCVGAMLSATVLPAAVYAEETDTVNIYWNDVHQHIDGFGAAITPHVVQHMDHNPEMLDFMFDTENGFGFSIARFQVLPDEESLGVMGNHMDQDGSLHWDRDPYQVRAIKRAQEYGATLLATPWSPPSWMKDNNSLYYGGHLLEEYYDDYAKYLTEYVKGYKEQHGIDISVLSVQNEPNANPHWASCIWSGDQFHKFVEEYLYPEFKKAGLDTKIMLNDTANFRWPAEDFPYLEDPEAREMVDLISGHSYWNLYERFTRGKELLKPLWQTETSDVDTADNPTMEYGISWATEVHVLMTVPEVNAFLFWYMMHRYANSEALVTCLCADGVQINKRAWCFANYSRFIRPGYWRVGADESPCADTFITAYKDEESGKCVAVCINDSTEVQNTDFVLNGFTAESVTAHRTSTTEDLENIGTFAVNGNRVKLELAPRSVTTFVFDGCETEIAGTHIEAETGSGKVGNAQNVKNADLSGGMGVSYISAKDNGVYFDHLPAAKSLAVRYQSLNAADCDYNVYVNDSLVDTVTFPSTLTGGTDAADVLINADIPENATVKITAVADCDGIIIDYIELGSSKEISGLTLLSGSGEVSYAWAAEAIETVNYEGIMSVTAGNEGRLITRGDFAHSLITALGVEAEWTENFIDATDGTSYYKSLGIGKAAGIFKAVKDNQFYPKEYLKRRDMFVMLASALEYKGKAARGGYSGAFTDWAELSEEEQAAVILLLENEIIAGSDGKLNPEGYVNNAAAATVLSKLIG